MSQENQQLEMKKMLHLISIKQEEGEKNIIKDLKELNISQSSILDISACIKNEYDTGIEKVIFTIISIISQ